MRGGGPVERSRCGVGAKVRQLDVGPTARHQRLRPHERGCLAEERVLDGGLTYQRPEERLPADEERFVLLAMHKILVERGLCLREHTDAGTMLIFASFVISDSKGEVRCMEIRDYLKRESDNGQKCVKQIVFTGERFDVMSVRRWREKLLAQGSTQAQ